MSPLAKRVVEALRRRADELNEISSDADTIASEIGSDPGSVHAAINQLIADGYFAGKPYMEGTGSFVVRLL